MGEKLKEKYWKKSWNEYCTGKLQVTSDRRCNFAIKFLSSVITLKLTFALVTVSTASIGIISDLTKRVRRVANTARLCSASVFIIAPHNMLPALQGMPLFKHYSRILNIQLFNVSSRVQSSLHLFINRNFCPCHTSRHFRHDHDLLFIDFSLLFFTFILFCSSISMFSSIFNFIERPIFANYSREIAYIFSERFIWFKTPQIEHTRWGKDELKIWIAFFVCIKWNLSCV